MSRSFPEGRISPFPIASSGIPCSVRAAAPLAMSSQRVQTAVISLLLAVAYFATGRLGLMLPAFGSEITLLWLPTGLSVAALLRWGFGCWPGIPIGAFAVNLAVGASWPVALGIAVGNTLGPLITAWLLRRAGFHPAFDRKREIVLIAGMAAAGMLFSSGAGIATLSLAGRLPAGQVAAWCAWWAGDIMGVILAAPLVLTMTRSELRSISRRRAEFAACLGTLLVVAWGVFVFNEAGGVRTSSAAFVPLPLVAWAALRFGAAGTSLALIVLSSVAAYGTATGHGPLFRPNAVDESVELWSFMATGAVLGWLISALHTAHVQTAGVQQLFEQALSDLSLGVLLAGLDGRITYANKGFLRLTGYTEADLLGKECAILQGPETDPAIATKLSPALHGGDFFEDEILNYRKDGTTFWNSMLVSAVNDQRGTVTGSLIIHRDVTERRQVEAALRESKEHLRTVIDLVPECVKLVSPDGRLLEMNPAGLVMIEADSLENVRGRPIEGLIAPEDREAFAAMHQGVVRGGAGRCEFAITGLKGTRRWMETNAVPYRNARGEIIGALGITRDITRRKEAAAKTERRLATLQLFINSIPAYISFVDADERYLLVNKRYEEYFGQPAERLIGQRLRDVQSPAAYAEMEPHVRAALAGEMIRYESNPVGPDGRARWFDAQYIPRRGDDGAINGFFVLVFDITQNKNAEAALREGEARFRRLIEYAPEAIVLLDVATGRFIEVNPAAERLFKLPAKKLCEFGPLVMSPPTQPDGRSTMEKGGEMIGRAIAGETPSFEWIHRDAEGRDIPCEVRLLRIEIEDRPVVRGSITDITERKRIEGALRESEERFRKIFETNPHPMWVHDFDTLRFLAVNDAALENYGYSREEFLAMRSTEIRPEEESARLITEAQAVSEGKHHIGVWRHRKRDGTLIDVEVTAQPIEFGGRRAAVVVAQDITERRRSEARNAGERGVLEMLASNAPLTTVLTRLARTYEDLYPGMLCSILLVDADGRRLRLAAAPSLPETFCRAADGIEIGPAAGSCGTTAYTRRPTLVADIATDPLWKNGRDLALSHGLRACWSMPVISSPGRVLGTFALYYREPRSPKREELAGIERGAHFASLAIERHALLRSLQESQARLETLVSNLPGMAYRCREDSQRMMTYVSDGCEALTGYRRDELEGAGAIAFGDLVHPGDRDWLREKRRTALEARLPSHNEYRLIDRQGRERWVSDRASAVHAGDGTLLFIDGFIQDITESRRAEIEREKLDRKMQETQKLESLGVLAGGIAHDFNNLLTSILGNASIAQIELPAGSSVQDCLEQITEASLRAADLCKQMLAYSGRGRFIVQKLDLGQLVEQTAQMLQISISKKAILRFHLEKGLPSIEADATQIRQVIMNLVINASEAIGDENGVIRLSTGLTRVDRQYLRGMLMDPDLPEGEYVFLEVADTGSGMSPETIAKIFDPFFTTKFTGRGLGLAAVLGIVRGHQGALKVYSEMGKGTTFKLLFPAASGVSEAAEGRPSGFTEWRGEGTVLVVDDEEGMRSTVARMMQKLGFEPVLAADGRQALDIFRAGPDRFTLVLLDLTMPHLDGEQTFAELRRLRPDVRVVLMSGFNSQEALVRFSGKGLASFLQKPFTIESLGAVMHSALARNSSSTPSP